MIRFNKFKDGKSKIVTMSYDDGSIFDHQLVEIFNKYNIKGTFHINSGGIGMPGRVSKDDITTLYAGHEVSLHTYSHPFLNEIPDEAFVYEIFESRKILESLTGSIIKGMSYPFGAYDNSIIEKLKGLGIVYSRTTAATKSFQLPTDFMKWHPTCHHNDGIESAKGFEPAKQKRPPSSLYIWGHSYEFDTNKNWDLIKQVCEMVSGYDDIWYATNIEIYNYITAQRRLEISADQKVIFNPSVLTVWVDVDGETVKIPSGRAVYL